MFSLIGSATSVDWFDDLMSSVVNTLTLDTLLYIFGGILIGLIIINTVGLIWSYEEKSMRAIKKINKYLVKHPAVNDSNLVEFNNRMKKLPLRIRERWQLFMLERVGSPSRYLSVEYCVKRPLYNSAVLQSLEQTKFVTILLAVISFIMSVSLVSYNESALGLASILAGSLTVPVVVIIFGVVYSMILQARYKYLNRDFYDMFTVFVRNVDKATNTMPDYVDYELLFTKREIEEGIPVLREYLEKKALEEQRLLEKAKREEVEHSPYNFDDLGINGAQLIERAVDESEEFLLHKIQLQEEINSLEKQYQVTEQNMDDIEREANKKLQAIKENLERLDKAIQETTNRVEINYNRRQAKEEMDKKTLLEKDMKAMLDKEKVAQDALRVEIEKRKEEIEKNKAGVEDALKAEYNTFATKVYDEIYQKVSQETAAVMHDYELQISRLKTKLKEFSKELEQKNAAIDAKNLEVDNLRLTNRKLKQKDKKSKGGKDDDTPTTPPTDNMQATGSQQYANQYNNTQYGNEAYNASHEQVDMNAPNLINNVEGVENGETVNDYSQYYDQNGNLIDYTQYYDNASQDTNTDYGQYYDENGNLIDYSQYYDENGNLLPEYAYLAEDNGDNGENGANVMQPSGYADQQMQSETPQGQDYYQQTQQDDQLITPAPTNYDDMSFTGDNTQQDYQQQYAYEQAESPENTQSTVENGVDNAMPTEQVAQSNAEQPQENNEQQAIDQTPEIETPVSEVTESGQASEQSTEATEVTEAPVAPAPEPMPQQSDENKESTVDNAATPEQKVTEPTSENINVTQPKTTDNWDNNGEKNGESPLTMEKQQDVHVEWENKEPTKSADQFETVPEPAKTNAEPVAEVKEEKPKTTKSSTSSKRTTKKSTTKKSTAKGSSSKSSSTAKKSTKKSTEPIVVVVEKPAEKNSTDTEDLLAIQKQIAEENEKLKKQQEELRQQIDETLSAMEDKANATKAQKQKNIKKIKDLIEKLKIEAKEAKARGASKAEITKINKSVAELLKVITNYQLNN